jgi:DNA helicase-2/ATP-dependent DNA helicase PcrA
VNVQRFGSPRRAVVPEALLHDLDPAQRDAVICPDTPLAIVAGPGAGKTRVLTRRIAWRIEQEGTPPEHVLAVTFTRKAAAELGQRLGALGVLGPARPGGPSRRVTSGTLHAVAFAQLRRRAERLDRPMPALLERKARVLVRIVGGRGNEALAAASELAGEIEWAKARLLSPEGYATAAEPAGRAPSRGIDATADGYARYERDRRRARLVDFDDLLWWCGDALHDDDEFAAEQRFRFRHLYVDEFQDVSPAQLRLLRGWLGDRRDLTVVGDPDQAIFSFTGADPAGLTRFAREFRGARVLRLDHNHRSTPEIVAVAEAVLADGGRARPARPAARDPGHPPRVTAYDTDDDEAAGVAARLGDAHGAHRPWSSFAVLYRTNAQSAAFEAALGAAEIPYRVRGDARFLDRPEVRAILDALRGPGAAAPRRTLEHRLRELEDTGGPEGAGVLSRDHAIVVARLGREYLDAEPEGSVEGFLDWLAAALRNEAPAAGGDAVELLTFHRAKGLEFDTVFVTGLERGLVPIARADTPSERAEERRLLYVALTRAEERLELSWARRRALGSRVVARSPSPWLAPIEAALTPTTPGGGRGADARARLDEVRDRLGARTGDTADPAVLEALAAWRRGLARAAGVPAFVIFHDSTLREIATSLPRTRAALLRVPGVGPVKVDRYAEAILTIVRTHADGPVVASA